MAERKGRADCGIFPAILRRLQLRINYRNHRKIVVIDNKVAYVGGFNVGKEYIDLDEKFGHWRDTHLRIRGSAVLGLQVRFILDWNYAAGANLFCARNCSGGSKPVRGISVICRSSAVDRIRRPSRSMTIICA